MTLHVNVSLLYLKYTSLSVVVSYIGRISIWQPRTWTKWQDENDRTINTVKIETWTQDIHFRSPCYLVRARLLCPIHMGFRVHPSYVGSSTGPTSYTSSPLQAPWRFRGSTVDPDPRPGSNHRYSCRYHRRRRRSYYPTVEQTGKGLGQRWCRHAYTWEE